MKLEIKKGKSLSTKYIKKWNAIMLKAFNEDSPLNPRNRKRFGEDIFFTLYNKNKEILSLGRLRPIKIKFLNKTYNILGGADLVSLIKRKGYGKRIKEAQKNYAESNKKTMIGFCQRKNTLFYKKCGLKIKRDFINHFTYPYSKKEKSRDKEEKYPNRDVTYLEGKDKFMRQVLSHPKLKVKIPIPHW